jgi:Flp pilus assembly protein TadD
MKCFNIGLSILIIVAAVSVSAQELAELDTIQRLASQGQWQTAIEQLDKRIATNSNDFESRFLKGLLLLQQNDTAGAREIFFNITQQFPHLPEAHNNLAAIYATEGKYELARQTLLNAVSNTPDYSEAKSNLGDLYVKLAVDAYQEALELNPGDVVSAAKLKLLEKMLVSGG